MITNLPFEEKVTRPMPDTAKYRSDLPLSQKLTLAEDLTHEMAQNGTNNILKLFPDLILTQDNISESDPKNLLKKGEEALYYSEEADITVAVSKTLNSPIYIFKGQNPDQDEFDKASLEVRKLMQEIEDKANLEAPKYINYSTMLYDKIIEEKAFAIFFSSDSCATCQNMEKNIKADLSNFPKNTFIVKADFDTETELKKKYEVESPSIIVIINNKGEVVSRLTTPSIEALKTVLKQVLS